VPTSMSKSARDRAKSRPTTIYKHPKQIELLGPKRVQTHAIDASIAQPTDALSSVCCSSRTRQTRLPLTRQTRCLASVARTCATCPDRLNFIAFMPTASDAYVATESSVCHSDRHGLVSPISENKRQTCPLLARQTRPSVYHSRDRETLGDIR
jgi:hypothetical protein